MSDRDPHLRRQKSKTNSAGNDFADRDLYSGLIRLNVLHHAVEGQIFGLGMIEELARHGYRISPGSLYPLLHGLEQKATCAPQKCAMASRCEKCTRRLRGAERRWRQPKKRSGNYFGN